MAKSKVPPSQPPAQAGKSGPGFEVVPLDAVIPDAANARRHPERNLQTIRNSLRRFGAGRSVVIDGKGVVRAGNGTLEAAADAGISELLIVEPRPGQLVAVRRSDWSDTETTAYAIADNVASEQGEWIDVRLAETLRALQSSGIAMEDVGKTDEEVDRLIDRLAGEHAQAAIDAMASGDGDGAGDGNGMADEPGSAPAGFRTFIAVLTDEQDADVREAVRLAKAQDDIDTTPAALQVIARAFIRAAGTAPEDDE